MSSCLHTSFFAALQRSPSKALAGEEHIYNAGSYNDPVSHEL